MDDRTADLTSISGEGELRGLYQAPMELAVLKQLDHLDSHCRNFLAHSPFAVIGSTRAGKGTDVSPRGDAPGFARVLDDHTIAIPDRPGNNRLDTMSNIVADADAIILVLITLAFRIGIHFEFSDHTAEGFRLGQTNPAAHTPQFKIGWELRQNRCKISV
jgi:predicted pyridoxine 5'-phosphate oxidase superfamily flavin-nucleotide-binding protein